MEIGDKNQEIGTKRNSGRIRGINRSFPRIECGASKSGAR
jgi:hypothetical protein